ncbi:MAG: hypothetical protein ACJAXA_000022 [Candidatus Aldehydirespiratoraceae bacterium]
MCDRGAGRQHDPRIEHGVATAAVFEWSAAQLVGGERDHRSAAVPSMERPCEDRDRLGHDLWNEERIDLGLGEVAVVVVVVFVVAVDVDDEVDVAPVVEDLERLIGGDFSGDGVEHA